MISVLVGVPISEIKAYCFEDFCDQMTELTYPNFDVLFVDNSPDSSRFSKQVKNLGAHYVHLRPKQKVLAHRLAESHEETRQFALRNNYDYLLHWESDIFAPTSSIIEMLLAAKRKVIGIPYHIGFGVLSRLLVQLQEPLIECRWNDGHFIATYDLTKEIPHWLDGKIKPVFHIGLGCMLIHRSVLEQFKFRYIPGADYFPDTFFAKDMHDTGNIIYCDTAYIAEHRNQPLREEIAA